MQYKINKWKYSPRKLSALLTKKSYTRSGSELSGEAQQREKPRAHRGGPALATQLPGDPRAPLRCLAAQVLPKKKGPKLCPRPAPLSSLGRAHGFLRRAFQMAPGGSSAKLHSLSKCCRRPVLPGKGMGDPRLLSAAVTLASWREQRVPPPTPCLTPCWGAPFPQPFASLTAPPRSSSARQPGPHRRGRRGHMPTEEREVRNPEGQQAGPRVTDGKGSSPITTNLGRLHKSSLLISAGVSPPLPSTLQNSSTVMGVRAHSSSNLTASERCKVLPTRICPRSPSVLHLNIPKYPSGLPLESRGILKASKIGGLLKLVPVSTPETSGPPTRTSLSKEDFPTLPFQECASYKGAQSSMSTKGFEGTSSLMEKGSGEPKLPCKQRLSLLCSSGRWR